MADQPIVALFGPTGVGKTDLGLELADRMRGEIVSCDSRQIFKQLTIGTAKPSPADLASVPHHFINELDLFERYSAGIFTREASERIEEIESRGNRPIVAGGSTLYAEALVHGFSDIPPTTSETRATLMERLRGGDATVLYDELREVDAPTASTLDSSKTQRVVRALEVFIDTGRPLSFYHENRTPPRHSYEVFVLYRPRSALYDRINDRVDAMLKQGLLDEVESILAEGYSPSLNALRTIGYREPIEYLTGKIDFQTMVNAIKQSSRRYAKRQLTWFRRWPEYRWVDLTSSRDLRALTTRILQ